MCWLAWFLVGVAALPDEGGAFGRRQGIQQRLTDNVATAARPASATRPFNLMPDEDPTPHAPVTATHTMALPARDPHGPYRVALLALHFGPLPPYLPYFLQSCGTASSAGSSRDGSGAHEPAAEVEVHCIVFHTDALAATDRPAGEGPRARLVHISAEAVAKRLMSVLGEDHCPSTPEEVLKNLNFQGPHL